MNQLLCAAVPPSASLRGEAGRALEFSGDDDLAHVARRQLDSFEPHHMLFEASLLPHPAVLFGSATAQRLCPSGSLEPLLAPSFNPSSPQGPSLFPRRSLALHVVARAKLDGLLEPYRIRFFTCSSGSVVLDLSPLPVAQLASLGENTFLKPSKRLSSQGQATLCKAVLESLPSTAAVSVHPAALLRAAHALEDAQANCTRATPGWLTREGKNALPPPSMVSQCWDQVRGSVSEDGATMRIPTASGGPELLLSLEAPWRREKRKEGSVPSSPLGVIAATFRRAAMVATTQRILPEAAPPASTRKNKLMENVDHPTEVDVTVESEALGLLTAARRLVEIIPPPDPKWNLPSLAAADECSRRLIADPLPVVEHGALATGRRAFRGWRIANDFPKVCLDLLERADTPSDHTRRVHAATTSPHDDEELQDGKDQLWTAIPLGREGLRSMTPEEVLHHHGLFRVQRLGWQRIPTRNSPLRGGDKATDLPLVLLRRDPQPAHLWHGLSDASAASLVDAVHAVDVGPLFRKIKGVAGTSNASYHDAVTDTVAQTLATGLARGVLGWRAGVLGIAPRVRGILLFHVAMDHVDSWGEHHLPEASRRQPQVERFKAEASQIGLVMYVAVDMAVGDDMSRVLSGVSPMSVALGGGPLGKTVSQGLETSCRALQAAIQVTQRLHSEAQVCHRDAHAGNRFLAVVPRNYPADGARSHSTLAPVIATLGAEPEDDDGRQGPFPLLDSGVPDLVVSPREDAMRQVQELLEPVFRRLSKGRSSSSAKDSPDLHNPASIVASRAKRGREARTALDMEILSLLPTSLVPLSLRDQLHSPRAIEIQSLLVDFDTASPCLGDAIPSVAARATELELASTVASIVTASAQDLPQFVPIGEAEREWYRSTNASSPLALRPRDVFEFVSVCTEAGLGSPREWRPTTDPVLVWSWSHLQSPPADREDRLLRLAVKRVLLGQSRDVSKLRGSWTPCPHRDMSNCLNLPEPLSPVNECLFGDHPGFEDIENVFPLLRSLPSQSSVNHPADEAWQLAIVQLLQVSRALHVRRFFSA
jgi:hypothetical protein